MPMEIWWVILNGLKPVRVSALGQRLLEHEDRKMKRLEQQLTFIKEIDKLKDIYRRSYLLSQTRKENSAEHSWHVALMALLLKDHADNEINVGRVVEMLLIHDIVEIDAGDTFCYDEKGLQSQHERERKAADRIFGLLPDDQGKRFLDLWLEYEAEETDDARFAGAVDRLMPLLHNLGTEGKSWNENGIVKEQVLNRNSKIGKSASRIWEYLEVELSEAVEKGILSS